MQKKKIIFYSLLIFLIIIFVILVIITVNTISIKRISSNFIEEIVNAEYGSPFSINKIVFFSSANCSTNINANSSFTINDLYQYTDIAIFINNNSEGTFTAENTLKTVKLSNIEFSLMPSVGDPSLYYKNINDFTLNIYDSNNKIENELEFIASSDEEVDFSQPILFNNCANPITLCYVNSNIKSNYTLSDSISNISYDGNLLKNCSITLNSIACKLSMLVTITNNLDEVYSCPIILTIPLSTENETIYDGSIILNNEVNYNFIKVAK